MHPLDVAGGSGHPLGLEEGDELPYGVEVGVLSLEGQIYGPEVKAEGSDDIDAFGLGCFNGG